MISTFSAPKILLGLTLAATTSAAAASAAPIEQPPEPFTATYQVLRDGQSIGEATITLTAKGGGHYEYANQTRGTAGLAAMLGVSSDETTRFRWRANAPETVTYDYRMDSAFKNKHRHLQVDETDHQVTVNEGKEPIRYPSAPGMVDRNTMPLALGLALSTGARSVTLPVGVKQRVEQRKYEVKGTESITVPAGEFKAQRIVRTDQNKPFDAWYVPQKYPLPIKISQGDGGDLTLQLVSFRRP